MADDIKFVIGVDDRDLIKAQKEQLKFQRNLTTIEKAFRSGDITAGRYNAELAKQARQLQTLGGSYNQASSEVRKYAYALRQADDATLSKAQAMGFAGKNINRMGASLQQVGYQVGDFAVQVQGGTNVMVALGQQGAQLAGIFGPAGAIAGAGLAITTAFLAPLMKTKEEARGASDSVDTLADSLKKLTSIMEEYATAKRAASLGITVDELLGVDTVEKASAALKSATEELEKLNRARAAASLLGGIGIMGLGGTGDLNEAKKNVEEAERLLAEVRAKVRQDAREKAEAILNDQYENQQRDQALAEYNAGQAAIAERVSWVEEATKIFRDAQKKMRDEEVAETERSLDRLFRNRTLMYSIRFSGDADVMSQALTPSTKGVKPTQSYQELIAMGWSPEDLERIGVKAPRKSGGSKKAPKDPLVELNKRITLDEKLLGVSKERETVLRAIANSDKEYTDAAINGAISRLEAYNKEKELLEEAAAQQQNIADTLKNSMEDAFMSIVDGTKSAEDAFKDMARMIISELYKVLVVQQMVGSFEAGGGGILGSIFGAIGKKASGGTVMSNQPYLVGEKGPEVIVPQNRGHVMNADLTAKAMGGSGEAVVVNQTFNFAANGDDSVKKLIAQAAPQIANMTQKQIMDSRRRGGAMKSTFG
jgi:hypothetical protein